MPACKQLILVVAVTRTLLLNDVQLSPAELVENAPTLLVTQPTRSLGIKASQCR